MRCVDIPAGALYSSSRRISAHIEADMPQHQAAKARSHNAVSWGFLQYDSILYSLRTPRFEFSCIFLTLLS